MMKKLTLLIGLMSFSSFAKAQSQQPSIWGVTQMGGSGTGTLFKTDKDGNNQVVISSFKGGLHATNPLYPFSEASDGKLYTTMAGGIYDEGVILELNPATGELIKKFDFNLVENGRSPVGMIMGPNGKFYGGLTYLLSSSYGAIFEYDPATNSLLKKIDFKGSNGNTPSGNFLLASNGKIYGTTSTGGDKDRGVLFEYDVVSNSLVKKFSFDDANNGVDIPYSKLVEKNGKLYGTSMHGGINSGGAIFEFDMTTSKLTNIVQLDSIECEGGLELGDDGLLYGVSSYKVLSPPSFNGTLFKVDPVSFTYTKILDFDKLQQGTSPQGGLKKSSNGLFYGVTQRGGAYDGGTLFEFNPITSVFTKLFDFEATVSGNYPCSLTQATNGKLYGATYWGGAYQHGTVFEYDIAIPAYQKITDLGEYSDGAGPLALSLASNGNIYTVAPNGGNFGNGILASCDPLTGKFTKQIDFKDSTNGSSPYFPPVQGPNGKLYGTTPRGGKYNAGTLYEFDPVNNILITKIHFAKDSNGYSPDGLVFASNQKLYGVLNGGGSNYSGVLFEYDPLTNMRFNLASFPNHSFIFIAHDGWMQAKNGKLYGVRSGHTYAPLTFTGALYEYDIAKDTLIEKMIFDYSPTGDLPSGTPVEAPNGRLYGVTAAGGKYGRGVIYEYDIKTNSYYKPFELNDDKEGLSPNGTLLLASNGKLYGTADGGLQNRGVLFEYDYINKTYTKKFDFTGPNGFIPYSEMGGNLIEVCKPVDSVVIPSSVAICVNSGFTIQSGFPRNGYTFQWYKDGTPIPLATFEFFQIASVQFSDAGMYSCKISNSCNTAQTSYSELTVLPANDPSCGGNAVEENTFNSLIELFPNPATDEFNIRIDDISIKHLNIELLDVLGRSVHREKITGSDSGSPISISQLENGMYWVRISNEMNSIFVNRKLIKQ